MSYLLYSAGFRYTEQIAEASLGSVRADGHKNAVWYDGDGQKLVHYFPHFLDTTVREVLKQAFRDLLKEYTPSKPAASERRSTRYEEWKAKLGHNTLSGVIRLTFHHQQQHSHDEAAGASADFLGRSVKKTTAAIRFRKAEVVQNVATWVSILFTAIDPPTWRRYREAYQLGVSHDPVLQNCDHGPAHCFVGHYLVINMLTTPHYNLRYHGSANGLGGNGNRWRLYERAPRHPGIGNPPSLSQQGHSIHPRPEFHHTREYDTEIHGNVMIASRTGEQKNERYVEPKDHDYKYVSNRRNEMMRDKENHHFCGD